MRSGKNHSHQVDNGCEWSIKIGGARWGIRLGVGGGEPFVLVGMSWWFLRTYTSPSLNFVGGSEKIGRRQVIGEGDGAKWVWKKIGFDKILHSAEFDCD